LMDKLSAVGVSTKDAPEAQVSAAEFLLEGLHAHKRIGRTEERVFKAEKQKQQPARSAYEPELPTARSRRTFN
jgi:magnesium chelatase subunit I